MTTRPRYGLHYRNETQMAFPNTMRTELTLRLAQIAVAVPIYEAIFPALSRRELFMPCKLGPGFIWISESFRVGSVTTPNFTSMEAWSILNGTGLMLYPDGQAKVLNLSRNSDGSFELVSFKRGDWEKDLLRYVGAPLGLLTIQPVASQRRGQPNRNGR